MKKRRTIVTLQAERKRADQNQEAIERLALLLVSAERMIVELNDALTIRDELIGVLNRKIASLPGSDIRHVDMPGKLEFYHCALAGMGCEHKPGDSECEGCGHWQIAKIQGKVPA